jgi:hypothetical protein
MKVEDLETTKDNVEAIYPLSPMQQAFLFHYLQTGKSELGCIIASCVVRGDLNIPAFKRAWQQVVDRHTVLRTSLHWEDLDEPLQVVRRWVRLPWVQLDWRGLSPAEQEERLESFHQADRDRGFDLSEVPLMRLALMQVAEDSYRLIWCWTAGRPPCSSRKFSPSTGRSARDRNYTRNDLALSGITLPG